MFYASLAWLFLRKKTRPPQEREGKDTINVTRQQNRVASGARGNDKELYTLCCICSKREKNLFRSIAVSLSLFCCCLRDTSTKYVFFFSARAYTINTLHSELFWKLAGTCSLDVVEYNGGPLCRHIFIS